MAGICGILNMRMRESGCESDARAALLQLERMLGVIGHRGPMGSRVFASGILAAGFNASELRELEEFDAARQNLEGFNVVCRDTENFDIISRDTQDFKPAGSREPEGCGIRIVWDGEIFNYAELREELEQAGFAFRGFSSMELLFRMYLVYGDAFTERINGRFAIALFDEAEEKLLLIRDHIGSAPLFYSIVDDRLIFASEIKAILECAGVERRLNLKALDQLMNYPGAVSPETFFKGVYSLRPGHMLKASPGRDIEDSEYWDISFPPEEDRGEEYYVENMRELLKKAIERRLTDDIPTGFYLSGGLDSSIVACFVSHFGMNSRNSFSAQIGAGELDESSYQQAVLELIKSEHRSVKVDEAAIWERLSDVVYYAESALKESYDVAAFMLSKIASEAGMRAVLTGQGSDEFLCGYVGYMLDSFRGMQRSLMSAAEMESNERLWGNPYFRYERIHPEIKRIHRRLYSAQIRGEADNFSSTAESPVKLSKLEDLSDAKRRCYIDGKLRLADHLLIEHGDSMTAAHSVNGRHPFLDKDLLRFILTMPDKYKLKGTNEKYILKKAGEGIVPEIILKRKKFPFQAPGMSSMFKNLSKGSPVAEFLSEGKIKKQGIFDPVFVAKLQEKYSHEDFKLMEAYEIDYLMIVLTATMLCERYNLKL